MLSAAALVVLLSATTPESAEDETPPEQEGTQAFTTVVTGSRLAERLDETPVAVEVIGRREIDGSGARNVAEALSAHPAIEIRESFAGSELWLQGLAPEYTLILVDGERVTGRLGGVLDLSRIPAEEVQQIEVVRGPSSVIYGSDAVAGVINIITRRAQRPHALEGQLSYGTRNQLELHGGVGLRRETWRVRLNGGVQTRDAYDLSPESLGTTGSALQGFELGLRGDATLTDGVRVGLNLDGFRRVQRGVDVSTGGATFDRANQNDSYAGTASLVLGEPGSQLAVTARASLFRDRFVMDQRNASALDKVEETLERLGRLGLQWDRRLGDLHRLTLGAEAIGEALDSDRLDAPGTRLRLSAYAQDVWTLPFSLEMQLVPGIRYDRDSRFGDAVSPRLALRLDPLETLTLRASYGWAFRAPDFTQQLIDFENPGVGYVVEGNPNLKPERSRGFNLAAEWRATAGTLTWLHLFRNELTDMIAVVQDETQEGTRYSYANVERALVQGAELGLRQNLTRGLNVGFGYTFTDARDQGAGRAIEGQSPHRISAQLDYRYRPWRLEAATQVVVVGARPFYESDERVVAPPYALLNVRVAHALGERFRIFLAGRNLLDAGDADHLPIPPRSFFAGISANL